MTRATAARAWAMALLVCVAATAPRADGWPPQAPAAAISGVAVDTSTGRPVPGVAVKLTASQVKVSLATLTDSQGRFVFTDLPPFNQYWMAATKPGYQPGTMRYAPRQFSGIPLSVGAGEWLRDLQVELAPAGSLSGRIVDEHGEPLVDVPVMLFKRLHVGPQPHWASGGVARTDDRGAYRFSRLEAGTYLVHVPNVQAAVPETVPLENLSGLSAEDLKARRIPAPPRVASLARAGVRLLAGQFAAPPAVESREQAYPSLFYPGVRRLADAMPIDLDAGDSRAGVDFVLSPVPAGRVAGRLIGPAEVIAGLGLRLVPAGSESLGSGSEQATAMADRAGAFVFAAVPAGAYTLLASTAVTDLRSESGGTATMPDAPARRAPRPTVLMNLVRGHYILDRIDSGVDVYSAAQPVVVGSDDVSGLAVVLERGATIRGRLVRDDGGPVPTRQISASPATGDPALGRFHGAVEPDGEGGATFSIQGMRRGEYVLGGTYLRIKSIAVDGQDVTARPFDLAPGVEVAGVLVVLAGQAASLSGLVRDVAGRVPPGAAVIVFPADAARWTNYGFLREAIQSKVVAGPDGYRFARLDGGAQCVVAVDAHLVDAWRDPRFLEAARPVAECLTLDWGESAVRDLVVRQVVVR